METRPNPDELLRQVQSQEGRRGKLEIFFGAAAGVGKTYAMLEAARGRKKEGVDVVIGIVEAHKRPETEALLEGLEVIPRKSVPYRNVHLEEFDLDAALKRKPFLILVDELAHTNAPGLRHKKRWQDVEELLEAGMNVYTTLNVQHCESVNDIIAQITGVSVRETVPDSFLEKANEVELVDLPTEDLLKRLREGKVYLGDQADRAIQNFFQPGNLIALRQMALHYTTKSVGQKIRSFKQAYAISKIWDVGEEFLVCVSTSPKAIQLVREGRRIATDLGAAWTVFYVDVPAARHATQEDSSRISEILRFAEKMGAKTVTLTGNNISDAILAYARSMNIGKVIIGKPERSRIQEILFGSIVNDLARKCGEIDLYLISGEAAGETLTVPPKRKSAFPWRGIIWAGLIAAMLTLVNWFLFSRTNRSNIIMVYLLGVVWVAYKYGRRVSVFSSFVSVLLFGFFFVPPYFTFVLTDVHYLITFLAMLVVGILISNLTGRLRQQSHMAHEREDRYQTLYTLSRDLSKATDPYELFRITAFHTNKFFRCPVGIFAPDDKKILKLQAGEHPYSSVNEEAVMRWVFEHRKIAGRGTDTLPSAPGLYLPLVGTEKMIGVLGIFSKDQDLAEDPEQMHQLELIASQSALAIESTQLARAALVAETAVEKERVRNLILTTFSSDLPKELIELSRAISDLVDPAIEVDEASRKQLIERVRRQAEHLNDLAKDLPGIMDSI
ncbi:MAG: hypothetical protein A3G87_00695 [Omnitrophica bacterium RIFCSPLOWO2_12_FULL_50_11]|nr:MAG: hypothetical protein A3G87_00695 [Omnitrophica bacterium RIFCSPLOWO2_12_FULL_50_11]